MDHDALDAAQQPRALREPRLRIREGEHTTAAAALRLYNGMLPDCPRVTPVHIIRRGPAQEPQEGVGHPPKYCESDADLHRQVRNPATGAVYILLESQLDKVPGAVPKAKKGKAKGKDEPAEKGFEVCGGI